MAKATPQAGVAHHLVDILHITVTTLNSRRDEPVDKLRIFFDVGDEIEHLPRRIGKFTAFGMFKHLLFETTQACR